MLDDLLGDLLGHAASRRLGGSRRAQVLFRIGFGLLGTALGLVGAVHVIRHPPTTTNPALLASTVATLLSLACFSLFNVALLRPWKWPGLCFVLAFAAMFLTRLAFGR